MTVRMVLIDSAWRELSIGGQFVKFDYYLDSIGGNLSVKPDWAELSGI